MNVSNNNTHIFSLVIFIQKKTGKSDVNRFWDGIHTYADIYTYIRHKYLGRTQVIICTSLHIIGVYIRSFPFLRHSKPKFVSSF